MLRPSSSAFARSSLQLPRAAGIRSPALSSQFAPSSRRWASSAPKIRYGFRGGLLRWGIAIGGIYWYATEGKKVLAEEPIYVVPKHPDAEHDDEKLPTVDEVFAARKDRQGRLKAETTEKVAVDTGAPLGAEGGIGGLEEEAEGEGAFNPETGEINWDCPCLGGMAHGPCGPEFKEAFSCFVFSKEEPKGVDCVDKFRGMQNCFREHPEIYGEELEGDDEDEEPAPAADVAASEVASQTAGSPAPAHVSAVDTPVPASSEGKAQAGQTPPASDPHELSSRKLAREQILHETDELVPRKWHDTTEANEKK